MVMTDGRTASAVEAHAKEGASSFVKPVKIPTAWRTA